MVIKIIFNIISKEKLTDVILVLKKAMVEGTGVFQKHK